ncbi:MAG: phosphoglucomutase [Treponema sp.]|nr:phosphoglucomutase [Treponema sp.]
MEPNMILSASGWRKVFAISGNEQDTTPEISEESVAISVAAASVFFDYLVEKSNQQNPVIAVGIDARPTGPAIADAMLHTLVKKGAILQYSGVTAAPEIMAYSKKLDGFIYISASHNPVGHNGIKFGINDGGVLNGQENAKLVKTFTELLADEDKLKKEISEAYSCSNTELKNVYKTSDSAKFNSLRAYETFVEETIAGTDNKEYQKDFFQMLTSNENRKEIGVVVDFNGSARAKCIDKDFFVQNKINFYAMNENRIVHEIIPEAENLVYVSKEMELLHENGRKDVILGYMPDCDGDRGNIVYWDEKANKSVILKAQEVFSLSVLAELTYSIWQHEGEKNFKPAVAVNCPTSMRIEEIAKALGAEVFRAEVGEANVVNLAREKRAEGYTVRILGEGSNGGTITYPSSVRDPLNTIFAILKLLLLKENGLFELWCKKRNIPFNSDFTLTDILETLPKYATTGVSESRAILHVSNTNHSELKASFQNAFEKSWASRKDELKEKYNICSYEAVITNGTKETKAVEDYSLSEKGGLKIIFKDSTDSPIAFIWMRGSGTEPVFRIMCDVKDYSNNMETTARIEKELLEWETELLKESDK